MFHRLFIKPGCFFLALAGGLASLAHADFVPIALTSGSYNQDMVVENTAPAPVISGGYTTASMDAGTGNSATSWYEQGYDAASPTTGLPHPGTTFTSQSSASHKYTMAPSYTTNNAVMLDATLTNATFTLTAPAAYSQLSFLESGGNNGVVFHYVVHHQNGTTESGSGTIPDWFNGGSPAFTANGRVDVGTFAFSNVNGNDPLLYSLDITLVNTASPVTSINFTYTSGGGHGAIMAVSGSTGSTFNPIAVTGYNEDIIVEAGAGVPGSLTGVTTATMDTGTANTANTWYESGYVVSAPGTGLRARGFDVHQFFGGRPPLHDGVELCGEQRHPRHLQCSDRHAHPGDAGELRELVVAGVWRQRADYRGRRGASCEREHREHELQRAGLVHGLAGGVARGRAREREQQNDYFAQ